jgi:hypothetical protein
MERHTLGLALHGGRGAPWRGSRGSPARWSISPDGKTLVVSDLPGDFKGWDIPAGRQMRGAYAWAAALAVSCLVLAGAGLDRWRGRRLRSPDESRESPEVGRGAR